MSLLDRPPIFLVGAQRSGTSWLQRLLAAHPAVVSGQESHLFSAYLAPLWERWLLEGRHRGDGGRVTGLACYLTEAQFLVQLRSLADAALNGLAGLKPGATRVLEKTPDHALHLPLIHRLFPDAAVVHVVRDGRDVVASLRAAARQAWGHPWTPATVEEAAARWAEWVRAVRGHAGLFRTFVEVRFEDLLADGPTHLATLFDVLGLSLSRSEVEDVNRSFSFSACAAGTAPESLVLGGDCRGRPVIEPPEFFRQGRAGAWQTELDAGEQEIVRHVAGPVLAELGYDTQPVPAPPPPPPPEAAPAPVPVGFVSTVPPDDPLWTWPSRVDVVGAPAPLLYRERLYLYATILALAPRRCLVLSTVDGWAAWIVAEALRDLGVGRLVALASAVPTAYNPSRLEDVGVCLVGTPGPFVLDHAGGLFDFVLLDGEGTEAAVARDLEAVAGLTAPGSVVLVHDAYNPAVAAGVDRVVDGGAYAEAGVVSRTCNEGVEDGRPVRYAGLRLLVRPDPDGRPRPPVGLTGKVRAALRRGLTRLGLSPTR